MHALTTALRMECDGESDGDDTDAVFGFSPITGQRMVESQVHPNLHRLLRLLPILIWPPALGSVRVGACRDFASI